MAVILGISALYHDSAAALIKDGQILAAAQEERFTRVKHDASFPVHAIRSCLAVSGLTPDEVTHVAFYEKPLLRFDRLMETYLHVAPRGLASFIRATGALVNGKLGIDTALDAALGQRFDGPLYYLAHHESHAASAFLPSPFSRAAILTADGVGEWATTSIGVGSGNRVKLVEEIRFPHSLGLLYSAFTAYLGFKVNSGEYKVMGLAPYGQPRFAEVILREMIRLKDDGSFQLDMRYFSYLHGLRMFNPKFSRLLGGPPRASDDPIEPRHMDVAASIQAVVEKAMLSLAGRAHEITGEENLCLAGGVALNCVANGRILREGPFRSLWIQPAAGDAGGALGAALFVWHQIQNQPRDPVSTDSQQGSLLGPRFEQDEVRDALEPFGAVTHLLTNPEDMDQRVVDLLNRGKIVGWFQGRMEFGPRALGSRSILADPRPSDMQSRVNLHIKYREGFRPFAPVVLRESLPQWFDLETDSPYMLLVSQVATPQRIAVPGNEASLPLMERLHLRRSTIPAVTHVDGTARIQSCDAERFPRLHSLLSAWHSETGCPVLLNTSFNVRGEPIVCSPEDAYRCFMSTEMDALAIGDFLLLKEDQPALGDRRRSFEPD